METMSLEHTRLWGGHRQGEHHIPLVGEQVLPEPEHRQHHRHNEGGQQGQNEGHRHQAGQEAQNTLPP